MMMMMMMMMMMTFRSCPKITEVDIEIISTVSERPGVCNNVIKNHLRDLFGNIRDSTKTVLGGNLPPPPVAGIRVNIRKKHK